MAGYNYTQFIEAVSSALESPVTDPSLDAPFVDDSYNLWLPRAIEAGEQRIYRELDLMATNTVDPTGILTPNARRFNLPSAFGTFIVVSEVVVRPTADDRRVLTPVTKEFLDYAWPNAFTPFAPAIPEVWCPFDQSSIFIGPSPDAAYNTEITGTVRPTPLSAENPVTPLTTYLPDLFLAASLVSFIGFQRDYGQASDDPKLALSWEDAYQKAKDSASVEQFRIRFASQGWGSRLPSPIATPPQS